LVSYDDQSRHQGEQRDVESIVSCAEREKITFQTNFADKNGKRRWRVED